MIDDIDEFFRLSFTDQLSLAMDDDYPCPWDKIEISSGSMSKEDILSLRRVGGTDDLILNRLVKMSMLAEGNLTIYRECCEKGKDQASSIELDILENLVVLRIRELFPKKGISLSEKYHFRVKKYSLEIFKKSPTVSTPPK